MAYQRFRPNNGYNNGNANQGKQYSGGNYQSAQPSDTYRKRSGAKATLIRGGKNAGLFVVTGWSRPSGQPAFYAVCFPIQLKETQMKSSKWAYKPVPEDSLPPVNVPGGSKPFPVFTRELPGQTGRKSRPYCKWICEVSINGQRMGLFRGYSHAEDPLTVRIKHFGKVIKPSSNVCTRIMSAAQFRAMK